MEHWKATLEDRPTSMPLLPFAMRGFRNPDSVASFHSFEIKLSTKLTSDLRLFYQDNAIKKMHLGLAALQGLLTQLIRTVDFVIGLGRVLKDAADVMPVRFKGSVCHTGEKLLEQTRNTIWDSHRYMHEPVKTLLKELGISRQTLLHQVSYNWLSNATNRTHDTDIYFKHAQDLVVLVREDNHGDLIVFAGLDQKLYDKEHAKTTAELYVRTLEMLVSGEGTEVGDWDIIPSEIREEAMTLRAGPKLEEPFESILQTLSDVLKEVPNNVAAKDLYGNQITYLELVDRAIAMSSDLESHGGVVQGTPVCVFGPPTIDVLCSIIGIWCASGIYVPLDHQASQEENTVIIKTCNADVCIVSQPHLVDRAHQLDIGIVFNCADMVLIEEHNNVDDPVSEDIAVAFHALASNKQPKGIILTHGNVMTLIKVMKYYFEGEVSIVLQHSNWTCDLSLFQILFTFMSGSTIVLAPTISPVNILRIMVQHKITAIVATPSEYSTWFQQPMNMLSSCDAWRLAFCCGENMSSAVVRNFAALGIGNLQLVTVYGPTETSIACCMGLVEYKEYSADKEGKLIPAGSVLPDYQLWVSDHLGRVLPPAWTGDI
jgi:non-ribosomal peptide synthetase component F